jgi:hypothetical protein
MNANPHDRRRNHDRRGFALLIAAIPSGLREISGKARPPPAP